METLTLNLPKLYGDHHVIEVRRILLALPGVEKVYASSDFRVVEVGYDSAKLDADEIKTQLAEAGYLDDLVVPVENAIAADGNHRETLHLRHSTAYEQTKQVISFAQQVGDSEPPLWPCPGLGVIRKTETGDHG
jgi:copper chaperone CopZ